MSQSRGLQSESNDNRCPGPRFGPRICGTQVRQKSSSTPTASLFPLRYRPPWFILCLIVPSLKWPLSNFIDFLCTEEVCRVNLYAPPLKSCSVDTMTAVVPIWPLALLMRSVLDQALPSNWLNGVESFLGKPPVAQLFKNFSTFYGTRRFITVFTRAGH
jgi:hypothetical protein